jgi:mxaJ protein
MRRRVLVVTATFALAGAALASDAGPERAEAWPRVLRVCADPNNLPFSDSAGRGFENRLAELIAEDLGVEVRYTWWAQRRGFVRNTLRAGACDLIPGVPERFDPVVTTAPYYRSAYVFVTRRSLVPPIDWFDDPRLRRLKLGVHVIGDDYANPPPVSALARRGIVRNVAGYSIYGDYRQPNPPARLIEAVARGEVDVAVVWGPLGGYFAARSEVPLRVTPVLRPDDGPGVPFEFGIAMAVRPEDTTLARTVNEVLVRHRAEVRGILERYGVPLLTGREPT